MDRGIKWFAWLALVVGIGVMASAVHLMLGGGEFPPTGLSCKALCGLSLIVSELLGEEIGRGVLVAFGLVLGAGSAVLGVKLMKGN